MMHFSLKIKSLFSLLGMQTFRVNLAEESQIQLLRRYKCFRLRSFHSNELSKMRSKKTFFATLFQLRSRLFI